MLSDGCYENTPEDTDCHGILFAAFKVLMRAEFRFQITELNQTKIFNFFF